MKKIALLLVICLAGINQMSAYGQEVTLGTMLNDYLSSQKSGFRVAAMLVVETGLSDTLNLVRDEVYEQLYQRGEIGSTYLQNMGRNALAPEHRNYGFTLFAETDESWEKALGKNCADISIEDIKKYLVQNSFYPETSTGNDSTNPQNTNLSCFNFMGSR